MVGREPPPPPRPRWINVVLIIAGVAILGAAGIAGVVVHAAYTTPAPVTTPAPAIEVAAAKPQQPGFQHILGPVLAFRVEAGKSNFYYSTMMRTETNTVSVTRQGHTTWMTPEAFDALVPEDDPPSRPIEFYTSVEIELQADPRYMCDRERTEVCTVKVIRCGQPLYVTPALAAVLLSEPGNDGRVAVARSEGPAVYRASVAAGVDLVTGAPLTMELQAATPAELQARVEETQAFIAARMAEGTLPVPTQDGLMWLPAKVAKEMAMMQTATNANIEAYNRLNQRLASPEAMGLRSVAVATGVPTHGNTPEVQAEIDAMMAKQAAIEKEVADEIARLEAAAKAMRDELLRSAASKREEADINMIILSHQGVTRDAKGRKIPVEEQIRKAGLSDRLPQFERMFALVVQVDQLRASGVSDRLRALNGNAPPAPRGDDRPIVWREEAANADTPYTGPGQRLENGDVLLAGREVEPKKPARIQRAPVIPDPIGLGERLVLIDTLAEKFGVDKTLLVGCSVGDLVVMYWGEVKKSGRPAPYPEAPAPHASAPTSPSPSP